MLNLNKIKWIVGTPCAAVIFLNPANHVVEALVHHGYTEVGMIKVSMPVDYDTEEPQVVVEPETIQPSSTPDQVTFDLTEPTIGMDIGGYKVTSLQGPRKSPCPGCSTQHRGLDVGTPSGTPLFAPGKIEVTCHYDSGGGGYFAQFVFANMLWQSLHLKANTCVAGGHEKGWKFAETGNTGRGSGPHLHLQLRHPTERWFIKVKKGHAEAILIQQGE
jgi:murein DD-endopeptidase MepM/ murein hydrolase activator NlpD